MRTITRPLIATVIAGFVSAVVLGMAVPRPAAATSHVLVPAPVSAGDGFGWDVVSG